VWTGSVRPSDHDHGGNATKIASTATISRKCVRCINATGALRIEETTMGVASARTECERSGAKKNVAGNGRDFQEWRRRVTAMSIGRWPARTSMLQSMCKTTTSVADVHKCGSVAIRNLSPAKPQYAVVGATRRTSCRGHFACKILIATEPDNPRERGGRMSHCFRCFAIELAVSPVEVC
jgi:hypothetical protein